MLLASPRPSRDEITLKAIRCTVKKAARKGLCHLNEQEDLTQEAFVHLLNHQSKFDPDRGSWPTFCSLLTRGFLYRRWQSLKSQPVVDSLNEMHFTEQGRSFDPLTSITERNLLEYTARRFQAATTWFDLNEDLSNALARLPPPLREICELFLEHEKLSIVAERLRVSCKTIYRRRNEIRELLKDSLLDEYL